MYLICFFLLLGVGEEFFLIHFLAFVEAVCSFILVSEFF